MLQIFLSDAKQHFTQKNYPNFTGLCSSEVSTSVSAPKFCKTSGISEIRSDVKVDFKSTYSGGKCCKKTVVQFSFQYARTKKIYKLKTPPISNLFCPKLLHFIYLFFDKFHTPLFCPKISLLASAHILERQGLGEVLTA